MGDPENTTPDQAPPKRSRLRMLRLSLVALLLVGYALAAAWVYRECTTVRTIDATGSLNTVSTCAPPSITSATVLVMLLLVVALLWPDISEVAVLGVSLKRLVVDAKESADSAREDVGRLRNDVALQITQISSRSNSTAQADNRFYFETNHWSEKDSLLLAQIAVAQGVKQNQSPIGPDTKALSDADLKLQLIGDFERLAQILGIYRTRPRGRPSREDSYENDVRQWFIESNRTTIDVIRSLRNAIAHGRSVPRNDVEEGLELAGRLIPIAESHLHDKDVAYPSKVTEDDDSGYSPDS